MSFGGGGSSTTQVQTLPPWLQDAAKENLARARYVSQIGYTPDYGIDVAAFSPMQQASMQNSANAAAAFGLQAPVDVMANMPRAKVSNLGFSGYSSGDLFDQSMGALKSRRPGQYDAINSMFVNPQSGSMPNVVFTPVGGIASGTAPTAIQQQVQSSGGYVVPDGGTGSDNFHNMTPGTEDFLLGLALHDYPAWAPGGMISQGVKHLAGSAIDKRMDAIQDSFGLYDDLPPGKMVISDRYGNLQVVDDPNYVPPKLTFQQRQAALGIGPSVSTSSGGDVSNAGSGGSLSAGRGSGAGANPSSSISGGSGRTDGGWGW